MAVAVRDANLDEDAGALLAFLRENLNPNYDEKRFNWLYRRNPYGRARAWIAVETAGNSIIGVAAAFPRLVRVGNEDVLAWNLADFAVSKGHRLLGPAVVLQRACLRSVLDGKGAFCYDHPSDRMMAVYERLGISQTGRVTRYVRLLRVDDKLKDFATNRILAGGLGFVGNLLVRGLGRRPRLHANHQVAVHQGAFGDEFSELDQIVGSGLTVYGRRTASYLNWRYRESGARNFEALTLRVSHRLMAYAIFSQNDQQIIVADLFGDRKSGAVQSVLAALVGVSRDRGASSINMPLLQTSPMIMMLRRAGFYPRESAAFVVCAQPGGQFSGTVTDGANWYLTHGDRDG